MEEEFPFLPPPDASPDSAYLEACRLFPIESWVVLTEPRARGQMGVVEEVIQRPEGPHVRVARVGLVPSKELRPATEAEIQARLAR